jgi:prepilin-type N-terminal cleavage/methylation domain-containing protein
MQPHLNKSQGFTLIEVTLVIIVMGLLMAGLAPLLLRQHSGTMEARDNTALEDAKTAIINYAISYGGIPDPLTMDDPAVGAVASPLAYATGVGLMPSSNEALAATSGVTALGVNNWGAYGSNTRDLLRLDVNNALKSYNVLDCLDGATPTCGDNSLATATAANHKGGDRVVFCQSVNAQMTAASSPSICQNYADRAAAADACGTSGANTAAFVLFSAGADRRPNQENDETNLTTGTARIYENDRRGTNSAPGETRHYDDQVKSYPLSGFARDCREKMGVSADVMSCAPGQKWVGSVTNNYADPVTYTGAGGGQVPGNGFTVYVNKCFDRASSVAVGTQATSLTTTDQNNDGRVDIVITSANAFNYQ